MFFSLKHRLFMILVLRFKHLLLIAAPPAFKIKKSERRKVKTSSPFSSNRDYNLNLNKKFELKKSDRKGTEFREFQQHRGDWKVIKQFKKL